eukprot:9825167-Ditylum_brightwellii.AAC.1
MAIPQGLYGRITPRRGLATKHHIDMGTGVTDPDFSGEIKVLLINSSQKQFTIKRGVKNAQMIFEECAIPAMRFFSKLPESTRGVGGFGSTDKTTRHAHVILDEDEPTPSTPITNEPTKGVHVIPNDGTQPITKEIPNHLSQSPPPIQAINRPTLTKPE